MRTISKKYQMLFLTMFCYLFFYTGRHNFGWATKAMREDLGISYTFIGWISFAMLIGYSIGQFINGNLADRFSPKYMVPLGAYLSIACNLGISFTHSPYIILILWFLNGYFQSMAWAPGGRIIANWFSSEERNKAFGMYTMAAGFSSAVTFAISIYITSLHLEWRMLFRIPVLLLLVSATVFLIFIKPSPVAIEKKATGFDFDAIKKSYKDVLGNKKFRIVCLSFGLESMARYGLIFWIPVHFLGNDWQSDPSLIWVTFLLPLGMALGAFSFGQLSTYYFKSNYRSIFFGMLICSCLSFLLFFTHNASLVVVSLLLITCGFFVYGPQSNFWALCPEIMGTERTGTSIGIMNMCGYLFAALGEPLLGFIIEKTGETKFLFIIIALICLLSSLSIYTIQRKNKE
ncbi:MULTISPECIES: MFS transporter [Flavobacterium]|uniref:MFS transporter n=1 Tax=Flavobacterium TaxID=237 RepID=UPI001C8FF7AD|nr:MULTISPECIES: MFS transporter [Flavobacterium]MCR4031421.1 MFS transporter [Flavobacterium panacis]